MEKPLETAQVGPKVGWERASRNHQGGANSVNQVDGFSHIASTAGSDKEQWPLSECLSGRKLPPALTPMPDNSVPPLMSLMPFNLLSLCWSSEGVSPIKSVHGPFKRNSQIAQQFLSSTASIPSGFYSQKLWQHLFLALEPWAGGLDVVLGPLVPEISLLSFICHTWVWKQPILPLCPFY